MEEAALFRDQLMDSLWYLELSEYPGIWRPLGIGCGSPRLAALHRDNPHCDMAGEPRNAFSAQPSSGSSGQPTGHSKCLLAG